MAKFNDKRDKKPFIKRLLRYLRSDPTRSMREMSHDLQTNRQRVWRRKRTLEEEHVIWGYTTIVDEGQLGDVMYLVLMKLRPMDRTLVDLIIKRLEKGEPHKQEVHLINVLYVNGEFDLVVMFTAPDHMVARRYYDSLRVSYSEHLLDKPVIADVNFMMIREGKLNPQLHELEGFIPV